MMPASRAVGAAVRWYWQHRFTVLFVLLLSSVAAHPLLVELAQRSGLRVFRVAVVVLTTLLAVALIAGVLGLVKERARVPLLFLGLAAMAGRTLGEFLGSVAVESAGEAAWVAICLLGIVASARRALRAGKVDKERIVAALDAYLLAGIAFSAVFFTLELAWPDSFGAPATSDLTRPNSIYFSFVTLATLGYGDIAPVSDTARGFAVLEAVTGQTYLAVLVARLVSLYGANDAGDGTHAR